jgi:hypothetical protein
MDVKRQMIEILNSDETRRIRFSFRGSSGATISVDQTSFTRVAEALGNGTINVVEGHFNDDKAMYSARAERGQAANTFYLGRHPRWSRLFNALIVHESVHASFDLTRSTLPWLDNEAAAYIAQAYYARNSGLGQGRFELGSHPSMAYYVVEELRAGADGDVDFFLGELRNSLDASPQYHDYIRGTFTGDG